MVWGLGSRRLPGSGSRLKVNCRVQGSRFEFRVSGFRFKWGESNRRLDLHSLVRGRVPNPKFQPTTPKPAPLIPSPATRYPLPANLQNITRFKWESPTAALIWAAWSAVGSLLPVAGGAHLIRV